jgi:hypothetical protein
VETHREQLVVRALASNPAFPWSELLDEFVEQLTVNEWESLSSNPGFVPDLHDVPWKFGMCLDQRDCAAKIGQRIPMIPPPW